MTENWAPSAEHAVESTDVILCCTPAIHITLLTSATPINNKKVINNIFKHTAFPKLKENVIKLIRLRTFILGSESMDNTAVLFNS